MSYTLARGRVDSSPEVQVISRISQGNRIHDSRPMDESVICAICSCNLDHLDLFEREAHCEEHFQEDSPDSSSGTSGHERSTNFAQSLSSEQRLDGSTHKVLSSPKQARWKWQQNNPVDEVFWYCALSILPPKNYTPGIIPILKKALWKSHAQGNTRRAALCYEGSVHISREPFDKMWGCGYRNFLMACTALMNQTIQPNYMPLLSIPMPGVRRLQTWIEDAWKAGFDAVGARDLKKLVGTQKWIGTADLWVAFTFRGIPAELVDFNLKRQTRGISVVTDWIVNYFSPKPKSINSKNINEALMGASPVVVTDRMPLILQHDGHSRTIVGYEISKQGQVNLLTFDPAHVLDLNIRNAAMSSWGQPCSTSQLPVQDLSTEDSSKALKRPMISPPSMAHSNSKRARSASSCEANDSDNDEVIFLSPSRDQPPPNIHGVKPPNGKASDVVTALDLSRLLTRFKLTSSQLGKKEYQILYFPMSDPLTERQKSRRKVVTSTRVC
ncbi:Zinc finger with UFM1-specific peptidase domain protein [Hypsizygus marmoreus]|uniref:Zinc finger with UFM1-specific peptidase domain protein n=1 Tax=Hypsizygus marmoreus TaxID=39966 RepID=A0A369JJ73_HYPMA|nr:Zinc finger with UFM1-specific peptidase domain protein [Hypsizygus marmoreus]